MNAIHRIFNCEGNCELSARNYDRNLWRAALGLVQQTSQEFKAEAEAKAAERNRKSTIKTTICRECHQDQFDLFDAELHMDLPLDKLIVQVPIIGAGRVYPKLVAILENHPMRKQNTKFTPHLEMLLWCCVYLHETEKLEEILAAEKAIVPSCVLSSLLRLAICKECQEAVCVLLKNGASAVKGLRLDIGFWGTPVGVVVDRFESQSTIVAGSFYAKTLKTLIDHGAEPPLIEHPKSKPSGDEDGEVKLNTVDALLQRRLQRSETYRYYHCTSDPAKRRSMAVQNARWLLFEADKDAAALYLNATPVDELDQALAAAVDFNASSLLASAMNSPQMASFMFGIIVMPLLQAGGRLPCDITSIIDSLLCKDWFLNVYERSRISQCSWQSPIVIFAIEMCRDKSVNVNQLLTSLERLAAEATGERALALQMLAKTIRSHYPRPLQLLARSAVLRALPQGAKKRREAIDGLDYLPQSLLDYLKFSDLEICWREMFLGERLMDFFPIK